MLSNGNTRETHKQQFGTKNLHYRLSVEDKENSEKSKQATSVVNLILPEVKKGIEPP